LKRLLGKIFTVVIVFLALLIMIIQAARMELWSVALGVSALALAGVLSAIFLFFFAGRKQTITITNSQI
jgi:hypothetical protein